MKFFKKTDIIIVLVLIVLSIGGYFIFTGINSKSDAVAEIYYNTQVIKVIDLSKAKDDSFKIPENPHVVIKTFSDGSICFEESDCPDKICIHSGKLSMPGQSAACLPNKVFIKIISKDRYDKDNVDFVGQ